MKRLAALALVLSLAGCAVASPTSPGTQRSMDAVAARVRAALLARPDIVSADVGYQNTLDAPAEAVADVTVRAGTALEPVLDDAERLLWLSTLTPLRSMNIDVTDVDDPKRGEVRHVILDASTAAALRSRYGARPVS